MFSLSTIPTYSLLDFFRIQDFSEILMLVMGRLTQRLIPKSTLKGKKKTLQKVWFSFSENITEIKWELFWHRNKSMNFLPSLSDVIKMFLRSRFSCLVKSIRPLKMATLMNICIWAIQFILWKVVIIETIFITKMITNSDSEYYYH